jgi:hypothetical protein
MTSGRGGSAGESCVLSGDETAGWEAASLWVARLGMTLLCREPWLAAALRQRYADFSGSGETLFTAAITLEAPQRDAAFMMADLQFPGEQVRLTAPGYSGCIDLQHNSGRLALASAAPIEDVEYFIRVAYAALAFRAGGMMLHAAGIVRGGQCYLFFGHSGVGKSTVARLSQGDLGLNDDLVILLPEPEGWTVYATPFWNPSQVRPSPSSAPVAGLFRLVQAAQVKLDDLSPGQAMAELLANLPVISADPQRVAALIARCRSLIQAAPVQRLSFLPDASFWGAILPGAAQLPPAPLT